MKAGDQVIPSGQDKTKNWRNITGIITKITKTKVYVQWDGTSFEDELEKHEVELFNSNLVLRFSDGVEIFTGGPYRIINESDGLYVTGRGCLTPVRSRQEGIEIISQMKENEKTGNLNPDNFNIVSLTVSLDELIKLNSISIDNKYNRNLVDNFHTNLFNNIQFELIPVMIHQFRNGQQCELHIRYLINTTIDEKQQLFGILDLPFCNANELLI